MPAGPVRSGGHFLPFGALPIEAARSTFDGMQNYGSVPGELVACMLNVGLADRPELAAIRAVADRDTIDAVALQGTGHELACGGVRRNGGMLWCRPDAGTLVLVDTPDTLKRGLDVIRNHARHYPTLTIDNQLLAVFSVVGRRTIDLLAELGVYRDLEAAPPCEVATLNASPTTWLLESHQLALCCLSPDHTEPVRRAISAAGRKLGLARVGQEALAQFLLVQRQRNREVLRVLA